MRADVAIIDGKIVAIGEVKGSADEVIDAAGRVVAPGVVDVHTHAEKIAKFPDAENFLRMGVTTIVTGNCGSSRTDISKFFEELEKEGSTINVATLIGHNWISRRSSSTEWQWCATESWPVSAAAGL